MLDEYKKHQKQHKVTVAKENRQIKSEFNNLYNLYDEQNRKKENSKKIKKLISKKLIAKRYNLEAIEKYKHRNNKYIIPSYDSWIQAKEIKLLHEHKQ
jgi:hypothetical protein